MSQTEEPASRDSEEPRTPRLPTSASSRLASSIEVTLIAENVEALGHVEAVTENGMWVRADLDVEDAYSTADRLEVVFSLPLGPGMVRLQTRIAGRKIIDRTVWYQLDFELAPPQMLGLLSSLLEAPINP